MPSPSLAVNGRAVAGLLELVFVFLERSNLLGLCRAVGGSGEPGSFLTMILGGPPAFRELLIKKRRLVSHAKRRRNADTRGDAEAYLGLRDKCKWDGITYALGGDDFAVAFAAPLGLPLPDADADGGGGGGGGAAAVLCVDGEVTDEVDGVVLWFKSAPYEGRS